MLCSPYKVIHCLLPTKSYIVFSLQSHTLSSPYKVIHCLLPTKSYVVFSLQSHTLSSPYKVIHCLLPTKSYIVFSLQSHTLSSPYKVIHCLLPTKSYIVFYLQSHTLSSPYKVIRCLLPTKSYSGKSEQVNAQEDIKAGCKLQTNSLQAETALFKSIFTVIKIWQILGDLQLYGVRVTDKHSLTLSHFPWLSPLWICFIITFLVLPSCIHSQLW